MEWVHKRGKAMPGRFAIGCVLLGLSGCQSLSHREDACAFASEPATLREVLTAPVAAAVSDAADYDLAHPDERHRAWNELVFWYAFKPGPDYQIVSEPPFLFVRLQCRGRRVVEVGEKDIIDYHAFSIRRYLWPGTTDASSSTEGGA